MNFLFEEMAFYLVYVGFGAVLAFVTMRRRYEWGAKDGEAPRFSALWLLEMSVMWPVYIVVKIWVTWVEFRRALDKRRKGVPKWYHRFF